MLETLCRDGIFSWNSKTCVHGIRNACLGKNHQIFVLKSEQSVIKMNDVGWFKCHGISYRKTSRTVHPQQWLSTPHGWSNQPWIFSCTAVGCKRLINTPYDVHSLRRFLWAVVIIPLILYPITPIFRSSERGGEFVGHGVHAPGHERQRSLLWHQCQQLLRRDLTVPDVWCRSTATTTVAYRVCELSLSSANARE